MRQYPNDQPPPGDMRDPERNLAKRAKASGHTRDAYLTTRIKALHETAQALGWDKYTLGAAVADVEALADEVYGPSPQGRLAL